MATPRDVLTPSQLNALARDMLEGAFPSLAVEGEISNLARPASGHLYFTLKDARAQVRCALFKPKSTWLKFRPTDGMQVVVRGRLTLYEPRGDYQMILDTIEEAGEGALRRAFDQLKAKLEAEGLFALTRKRPLPRFVRRLGIITSPSGAAIRDVLSVLRRRCPLLEVEILPAQVQGEAAPAQLLRQLQGAIASGRFDVLLLSRGGGSLEDLWAFNDEALARAIVASPVPVVSAVGHEVDFSIADFVADLRAPTPSAAAELLVPDRDALRRRLRDLHAILARDHGRVLRERAQRLDQVFARLQAASPRTRLLGGRQRLAHLAQRLPPALRNPMRLRERHLAELRARLAQQHPERKLAARIALLGATRIALGRSAARCVLRERTRLDALARALHAVSPLATVARGYAILRDRDSGALLRRADQAHPGQALDAQMTDGVLPLRVDAPRR